MAFRGVEDGRIRETDAKPKHAAAEQTTAHPRNVDTTTERAKVSGAERACKTPARWVGVERRDHSNQDAIP